MVGLLSGVITKREKSVDLKYIYIGTASAGSADDEPVWNIRRIEIGNDGNFKEILWANGNELYNCKWSDRLTLEYR